MTGLDRRIGPPKTKALVAHTHTHNAHTMCRELSRGKFLGGDFVPEPHGNILRVHSGNPGRGLQEACCKVRSAWHEW